MKIRQIISIHPHNILRSVAVPVTDFGDLLVSKVIRMRNAMERMNGIGIAANQCFMEDDLFIAKIDGNERIFANARIVDAKMELVRSQEGCLSVPGIVETVNRFSEVTVTYQDETGIEITTLFSDDAAVIVQHEIAHLRGQLFIDNLSDLKKGIIKRKMLKFKKHKGLI